jgi:hypothetical protein
MDSKRIHYHLLVVMVGSENKSMRQTSPFDGRGRVSALRMGRGY